MKSKKPRPLVALSQATRRLVWRVVSGYLTRWRGQETIRFIKQRCRLADLRVLDDERLCNLAAWVMAAACFAAVWLGESLKQAVLASRGSRVADRCLGVPEFHYHALADGIRVLRSRLAVWCLLCRPVSTAAKPSQQPLFAFG